MNVKYKYVAKLKSRVSKTNNVKYADALAIARAAYNEALLNLKNEGLISSDTYYDKRSHNL